MNQELLRHLAPFHAMQVVFQAPKRPDFVLSRFHGPWGAVKLLLAAMRNHTKVRAELAYNEGLRAHSIGRYQQAEENYTSCLRLQPDHEPAFNNLASLYLDRSSEELAIECLNNAIKVRPYFYRGYYNLGLVYRMMGKFAEAKGFFEQALQYNPSHFYSYVAIAEVFASVEDLDRAIEYYQKSEPFCSDTDSLMTRLAELHLRKGDLEACEACLKEALAKKESGELHYNLGWVLAQRGADAEHLIDCFLLAYQQRSEFKEALQNLAFCQASAGYHEQAVNHIMEYVTHFTRKTPEDFLSHLNFLRILNPTNQLAAMKVAELHVEADQIQQAIEVLDSVLNSVAHYSPAIEMLADLYRRLGRFKDAIVTFRRLVEADPGNVVGYLGLARSYADIENYAAAMPVLQKILELDPKNAQIHYQLATLLAQNGDLKSALRHYKMVATLDPSFPRIQKRLRMLEDDLEEEDSASPKPWPAMLRRPT